MPTVFVVIAAILWGMIGPLSRFLLASGVPAIEIGFWRVSIGGAIFVIHASVSGAGRIERRDLPAILGFGLFGVAVLEASNLLAVSTGGAALAAILLYTAPVWVAVFSRAWFKEPMPPRKVLALGVALAGVAGVALSGSASGIRFTPAAIGWGILSGMSFALFYLFGKAYLKKYPPLTLLAYSFPIGGLGLLPFFRFEPAKSWANLGILLFLGVATTYVAYFLYYSGLRRMDATRAAILGFIEPLVSTALAFFLWNERLGTWGYFWAAWVCMGVLMQV